MAGTRRIKQIAIKVLPAANSGNWITKTPRFEVTGHTPKFKEPTPTYLGGRGGSGPTVSTWENRREGPEERRQNDLGRNARKKDHSNSARE